MQAIITKYVGPTSTRGSRIKAISESGESITVPYGYAGSPYDEHKRAAEALIAKLGWSKYGRIVGGSVRHGYAWVFVSGEARDPARRRARSASVRHSPRRRW